MSRKPSRAKPAQSHHYHVRVNRDRDCRCNDDVAGLPPESSKLGREIPAHRMPQQGIDPMREILGLCDKFDARLEKIFAGLGLDLPEPVAPESASPIDQIMARLRWLDSAITVAEYHASGLERAKALKSYQPRGREAEASPISNMANLTFAPEHQRNADAPVSAIAQTAHGLGPAPPLSAAEARSMTSPARGPSRPIEDAIKEAKASRASSSTLIRKAIPIAPAG